VSYADDKPAGSTPKLVFNRYGDQYFLRKIISSAAANCMDIPVSKLERRVRWQESKLHEGAQATVALK
jgi:hypothetical protein